MKIELVAQPGEAPEALLGAPSGPCAADVSWSGLFGQLQASLRFGGLIREPMFAADLSRRWQRLVVCTPEFAAWWRAREGEPAAAERIFFADLTT